MAEEIIASFRVRPGMTTSFKPNPLGGNEIVIMNNDTVEYRFDLYIEVPCNHKEEGINTDIIYKHGICPLCKVDLDEPKEEEEEVEKETDCECC